MISPYRALIVSAFAFAAVTAAVACSDGPGGDEKTVQALTVVPATQDCPSGYQHPKVCCSAAPDTEARCVVNTADPFAACEDGSTEYDDGGRCCNSNDLDKCLACDDGKCGDIPQPPASDTCNDACPPGWYGDSLDGTQGCCQSQALPDGSFEEGCMGWAGGSNVKFCLGACPDSLNHDPDHPCCGLTNKSGEGTGFRLDIQEDCSYPIH